MLVQNTIESFSQCDKLYRNIPISEVKMPEFNIEDNDENVVLLRGYNFLPARKFTVTNNTGERLKFVTEGREIKIQKGDLPNPTSD